MFGSPTPHSPAQIITGTLIGVVLTTLCVLGLDALQGYDRSVVDLIRFLSLVFIVTAGIGLWEQRRFFR